MATTIGAGAEPEVVVTRIVGQGVRIKAVYDSEDDVPPGEPVGTIFLIADN